MKNFIYVVLVVCLLPSLSFAGLESVSGPFTTTTPIPATSTDWSSTLSFPQFNPSLGTLEKVQIDLSGSMSTVLTITNEATISSSGNARTEVLITVQDAGNNLNAPELDLMNTAFSYSLGPHQSVSSGTRTKSGSSSDQYTDGAVLTEFTGTGAILLNAGTFTQTLLANTGGNTSSSQVTNAQLTGTVTYYYLIPEPTTMALLGLGTLGLLRRKK